MRLSARPLQLLVIVPVLSALTLAWSAQATAFDDADLLLAVGTRPGTGMKTPYEQNREVERQERMRQEAEEDRKDQEAIDRGEKPAKARSPHRKRTAAPPAASRRPGTGNYTGVETTNSRTSLEQHERAAQEFREARGDHVPSAPAVPHRPGKGVQVDSGAKRTSLRETFGLSARRAAQEKAAEAAPGPEVRKTEAVRAEAAPETHDGAAQQIDDEAGREGQYMRYRKSDGSDAGGADAVSEPPAAPVADEPAGKPADSEEHSAKDQEQDEDQTGRPRRVGVRRPGAGLAR